MTTASTYANGNAPTTSASVPTLADYLLNGYWAWAGSSAHHWSHSNISVNITGLNATEQALATAALTTWSDVANVTFSYTSGTADITFDDSGSMQAVTNASWSGSSMLSATVNISSDWVTTDGGYNDLRTGTYSYAFQTYVHEIGHALGLGHQGP